MNDGNAMGQVIQIDEARIRDHLGEMVRGTVEETLNAMLEAEADQLCGAGRYERSPARQDTRAGSYERTLHTKFGRRQSEGPEATAANLRDGDYRALPEAGELGRGGADRDVSGRDFGSAGRRHHGGAVGHPGQPEHSVEPELEDLYQDRGVAESQDRRRASVSLPRRHRDEAQLGW